MSDHRIDDGVNDRLDIHFVYFDDPRVDLILDDVPSINTTEYDATSAVELTIL